MRSIYSASVFLN